MSIKYEISVLPTHILCVGEGTYELAEAIHAMEAAFKAASAHKQTRILLDARKMRGNPSLMQRFEFGEAVAKLYSRRPEGSFYLIALVGNEPLLDVEHFGEVVAVNRAVPYKATMDMQEALDWLKIPSGETLQTPK